MTRRAWTATEIETLMRLYPDTPTCDLARQLKRSVRAVYQQAEILGVRKDPALNVELGKRVAAHPRSIAARYKKGHVPANKGVRRPGYAPGRYSTKKAGSLAMVGVTPDWPLTQPTCS